MNRANDYAYSSGRTNPRGPIPILLGDPNACRLDRSTSDVFSALRRSPEEFANEMRLAAAMHWYSRGEISQEKAAAVAGLDRADFLAALAREKVDVFAVDRESLKREMERG